jgi:hypothetical protein
VVSDLVGFGTRPRLPVLGFYIQHTEYNRWHVNAQGVSTREGSGVASRFQQMELIRFQSASEKPWCRDSLTLAHRLETEPEWMVCEGTNGRPFAVPLSSPSQLFDG